ncbi:MAG: hypothetical protein ACP5RG_04505 [Thermoplasmata archaeon]
MNDKENISVKGVQSSIYERVKELARETGKTIGEITNESYKIFISAASETKAAGQEFLKGVKESQGTIIENISTIEITGEDLRNSGKKVIVRNINNLILKDIKKEDFENYISAIVNVKHLEVPKSIPKLLLLERSKFIDEIKFM